MHNTLRQRLSLARTSITHMYAKVRRAFTWQAVGNNSRSMIGGFARTLRFIEGRMSRSTILCLVSFLRHCHWIHKTQGPRGLAQRLKIGRTLIMKSAGHDKMLSSSKFGQRISINGGGLPRFLPPHVRKQIRCGDAVWIKRALTLCGLYKVIEYKGRFSLSTITQPWTGSWPVGMVNFMPTFHRYLGSPNLLSKIREPGNHAKARMSSSSGPGRTVPSSITNLSIGNILSNAYTLYHSVELFPLFEGICALFGTPWWADRVRRLATLTVSIGWLYRTYVDPTKAFLGAIAQKEEPGKVRVFAMLDYWSQLILYPLHVALFGLLQNIPEDCTFDQGKGVKVLTEKVRARIPGDSRVYSFDLSSATDRLPVVIQSRLLDYFVPGLGALWLPFLTRRDYLVQSKTLKKGTTVRYGTGQPMGAYSSFAMLALIHHFIIQFAAWKAGYRNWFTGYAVLGDDSVILDSAVAHQYLLIMDTLGVPVSPHKSLVSRNGSFEFAARFVYKGTDVSPISLKEVGIASGNLTALNELANRHQVRVSPGTLLAFLGKGYRVRGALTRSFDKLSRGVQLVLWFYLFPGGLGGNTSFSRYLQASSLTETKPFGRWIGDVIASILGKFEGLIPDKFPTVVSDYPPIDHVALGLSIATGKDLASSDARLARKEFHYSTAILGPVTDPSVDMTDEELDALEDVLASVFRGTRLDLLTKANKDIWRAKRMYSGGNARAHLQFPLTDAGIDLIFDKLDILVPVSPRGLLTEADVYSTPVAFWSHIDRDPLERVSMSAWLRMKLSFGK
jgi:hypothetical protein